MTTYLRSSWLGTYPAGSKRLPSSRKPEAAAAAKILGVFSVMVGLVCVPISAHAATSVTTHNITFTFDTNYTTGTFVDGEPWVVENTPGGGVTVTSMTPAYASGRHGWEVNPVTNQNRSLDKRITDSGVCNAWTAPPALPRKFNAGDSVLKVRSVDETGDCYRGTGGAIARTCIAQSSVLTVLASAPPSNSFRPPYPGSEKPIFSADLNLDILLPNLPELTDVASQISIAQAEATIGGPWIEHAGCYNFGRYHATESMLTVGGGAPAPYGASTARSILSAINRTFQGPAAQKRNLVNKVIQVGIDTYFAKRNGKTFEANGGIFVGRKPLILYTGYMLSPQEPTYTADMLDLEYTGSYKETLLKYHEDGMTYSCETWDACESSPAKESGLWGRTGRAYSAQKYYDCANDGNCGDKTLRHPVGTADGGYCMSGTACSGSGPQPTPQEQRNTGQYSYGPYQRYTHVFFGGATVARVLDLEGTWDWEPFFAYTDRLATPPWNYNCSGYCSSYLEQMHRAYGCNSTECSTNRGGVIGTTSGQTPAAPILLPEEE